MPNTSNRSVIIVSGLLTLLLLIGATFALGLRNGWVQLASDTPTADAGIPPVQPDAAEGTLVAASAPGVPSHVAASTREAAEVVLYRQKLDEAYRALDEAYAQIRSLQTSQTQVASRSDDDDDDDDHRDRRSRRRKSEHD